MPDVAWVAVDWGTSNVRAWGIAADGSVAFERSSAQGMGKLAAGDYPGVLDEMVRADLSETSEVEVLVCGMAGARTGWREAGYLDAPADLGGLAAGVVGADGGTAGFRVHILPGICQRRPGAEDVMRGEETQLLGLSVLRPGYAGVVIMPGTHSKWAWLSDGRLERFTSAMTGELFEVLRIHSVLRLSLGGEQVGPHTEDGVAAGLDAGLERPDLLTSLLFRTRAASLLSDKGADWCAGYLSGLLVGAEVGGHRNAVPAGETVPLIGSARLCRLYAAALKRIGIASETVDVAKATLAGLTEARRRLT